MSGMGFLWLRFSCTALLIIRNGEPNDYRDKYPGRVYWLDGDEK